MVETPLAEALFETLPISFSFLIGRKFPHQLPSVGPRVILNDFVTVPTHSNNSPNPNLGVNTQQQSSIIVSTAHNIVSHNPQSPIPSNPQKLDPNIDLYFIPVNSPEQAIDLISDITIMAMLKLFGADSIIYL